MRLNEIVGQDHALGVLRRALAAGRLAHAYVFDGPTGVGKRTTALALGLALLCPEAPNEGCGRCETCRRVLARNHPDVWVFDVSELPDLAKSGGGERSAVKYAAREVFPYALLAPHEAPARVLVLDRADEMSPDVQNTLLKTLEEPRPRVHIVLVTSARDRLLPTILSRTQRIRFLPVGAPLLLTLAATRGIPRERAETAAALAGGEVARFLALAGDETPTAPWEAVTSLRRAAAEKGIGPVFDAASGLGDKESKEALPEILTLLSGLYRDAVAAAVGADELVVLRERAPEIERLASAARRPAGMGLLRRALQAVVEADLALKSNVNAVTVLERMLLDLRPCERNVTA